MIVDREGLVERLANCSERLDIDCPDLNAGERGALRCAQYCIQLAGMLIDTRILKALETIEEGVESDDE